MAATVAGIHLGLDTHANRPAGNSCPDGSFYSCSTHSLIYKSNFAGNSWATYATLGTAASGSITASGYTQTTARLLGRTTASTGAIEEITVGSGLSLAGGTITATGGSGNLAGTELDYVQFTATVSPTATSEATANTVVTGNSVAYDGSTIVLVEFWAGWAAPDANALHDLRFWLYDTGTSIGFMGYMQAAASGGNSEYRPVHLARRITPSNASHTYSIRASVDGGTGSIHAGAGGIGAEPPGFIRITRVSP